MKSEKLRYVPATDLEDSSIVRIAENDCNYKLQSLEEGVWRDVEIEEPKHNPKFVFLVRDPVTASIDSIWSDELSATQHVAEANKQSKFLVVIPWTLNMSGLHLRT